MLYDFSSLDFDTLKVNIIKYIKTDDTFKDYNFDGSALQSIANLLTYITLQQNFYLNMTTQELYLDTATLYRNVTSIAKSLNYIPYRMTPAKLTTDISFLLNGGNVEIPQYCNFLVNDVPFVTRTVFNAVGTTPVSLELWQTEIVSESYNYADVPNELLHGVNIADDYVIVKVGGVVWSEYDSSETITSSSEVYFLSLNHNNKLVVTFGDNRFGKKPTIGVNIDVVYGITLGTGGNSLGLDEEGLPSIDIDQVITSLDIEYSDTVKSYGGADFESLDSIKINAPKFYESQNRTVTANDYKVFVSAHAPTDAHLVNVWSGSDNIPPVYGTVYITVKPNSTLYLTNEQKTELKAYLSDYKVMSIRNEILDANYIYVDIETKIYYYNTYGVSTSEIQAEIESNMDTFFDTVLNSFDTTLKFSNLLKIIDTPKSVSNNVTSLSYFLKFDRSPNHQYNFNLGNIILEGSLINDYIYDNGGSILNIADDTILGTIDYNTGIISFTKFLDPVNNKIYFKTQTQDIFFNGSNLPLYNSLAITFEGI